MAVCSDQTLRLDPSCTGELFPLSKGGLAMNLSIVIVAVNAISTLFQTLTLLTMAQLRRLVRCTFSG